MRTWKDHRNVGNLSETAARARHLCIHFHLSISRPLCHGAAWRSTSPPSRGTILHSSANYTDKLINLCHCKCTYHNHKTAQAFRIYYLNYPTHSCIKYITVSMWQYKSTLVSLYIKLSDFFLLFCYLPP